MLSTYFKDKICTIITVDINLRNLSKLDFANVFTGKILEINDSGVLLQGLHGLKSFFYKDHIIGIVEEMVVKTDKKPDKETPVTMESLNALFKQKVN